MFLLDTNVVSHASKAKQNPIIKEWFKRQTRIAIPFPVFTEIRQGIVSIQRTNPEKAAELSVWLETVIDSDFYFPPMTPAVALKLAELYDCGPLKHLWYAGEQKNKKPGQDLAIAAISIIHQIPIATLDGGDFAKIDSFFALPGVYNPAFNTWVVHPVDAEIGCNGGALRKHSVFDRTPAREDVADTLFLSAFCEN
jgi:predicted nucleic acid-binding protein